MILQLFTEKKMAAEFNWREYLIFWGAIAG
jgi:hypothetical protein